jgi:hypothetical protein
MRVVADREMDGRVDRLGCEIGERRCRVCRGRGQKRRRVIVGNGEVVRGGLDETIQVSSEASSDIDVISEVSEDVGIQVGATEVGGNVSHQTAISQQVGDTRDDEMVYMTSQEQGKGSEGSSDESSYSSEDEDNEDGQEGEDDDKDKDEDEDKDRDEDIADDVEMFTQEMDTQASIRREQIEETVAERWTVEQVERIFDEWKHRCVICKLRYGSESGQGRQWRECNQCSEEEKQVVKEKWEVMKVLEYRQGNDCPNIEDRILANRTPS